MMFTQRNMTAVNDELEELRLEIGKLHRLITDLQRATMVKIPVYTSSGDRAVEYPGPLHIQTKSSASLPLRDYVEKLAKADGLEVRLIRGSEDAVEVWK